MKIHDIDPIDQWSLYVWFGLAAATSLANWLKVQIIWPYPRPTKSETGGVGQQSVF